MNDNSVGFLNCFANDHFWIQFTLKYAETHLYQNLFELQQKNLQFDNILIDIAIVKGIPGWIMKRYLLIVSSMNILPFYIKMRNSQGAMIFQAE